MSLATPRSRGRTRHANGGLRGPQMTMDDLTQFTVSLATHHLSDGPQAIHVLLVRL